MRGIVGALTALPSRAAGFIVYLPLRSFVICRDHDTFCFMEKSFFIQESDVLGGGGWGCA